MSARRVTEQRQRTEKEIAEKLDKLPDVLKGRLSRCAGVHGNLPSKAEAVVEQFNRDLCRMGATGQGKTETRQKSRQSRPRERAC